MLFTFEYLIANFALSSMQYLGFVLRVLFYFFIFSKCLTVSSDFFSQRFEIVQWVVQGGGRVVDDNAKQKVHFIIECHGVIPRPIDDSQTVSVSSHWIRSCLEVCLVNVYAFFLY